MTRVTMISVRATFDGRWSVRTLAAAADAVKLPVARDPRTQDGVHLPGTSIVGSLRSHLGGHADKWLGPPPGAYEGTTGAVARERSRLGLLGSFVDVGIHKGGSTRVDPRRGAATGRSLREHEWATGTALTMAFQHDGEANQDLIDKLCEWQPYLGAGRSSGLGATTVDSVHTLTLDLSGQKGLAFWLGPDRTEWFTNPREIEAGDYLSQKGKAESPAWCKVEFTVKEPLHVGGHRTPVTSERNIGGRIQEHTSEAKDTLRIKADGAPFLPGASWRGVFRHRMRTILSAVGATDEQRCEVLKALFGSTKRGRGPLWFADSEVDGNVNTRTHVAIDRFTGGARDGAHFTIKSVDPGGKLTLRYRWEHGEVPTSVENLIRHVLRDLHDGLASVGGMGTRGYGWIEMDKAQDLKLEPVVVDELVNALTAPANDEDDERKQP